jgi:hypothetical protein
MKRPIYRVAEGVYKIRWREGGRQKSSIVHGAKALAKKILNKKLSTRDENRHLDVKKEVNFKMSALVERYTNEYAEKKKSREECIGGHQRDVRSSICAGG